MLKLKRTITVDIRTLLAVFVALMIGFIIGVTVCPQKDYSSCIDVAEQDRLIVSQDGVITDLAIQTMNGRNTQYNKAIDKCLELSK